MKLKIIIITVVLIILITTLTIFSIKNKELEDRVVFNKIEQLEQLATAKQIYREIIYSKKTADFLWMPITSKEFLISIDFSLTAGIDISKGYEVDNKNGYFLITLPKGELLTIDAVDSSITEYFTKQRFSTINRDDYFKIIQNTKNVIIKSDTTKDLISECEDNAKEILKSILQVSGIVVDIKFSDSVIKEKM